MSMKVKDNGPHSLYQPILSQDAFFVQIWWFQSKTVMSGKSKFPRILNHNGQNDLEGQEGQWPPIFNTRREYPVMHVWCKFGDFTQLGGESSRVQSAFLRTLSQNGQNDLEDQGQWSLFAAGSIPWFVFVANLMILAQICDELSGGQD